MKVADGEHRGLACTWPPKYGVTVTQGRVPASCPLSGWLWRKGEGRDGEGRGEGSGGAGGQKGGRGEAGSFAATGSRDGRSAVIA